MRLAEREAGIKRRVHPHLFRNSAATWMRTKGLDPLTIARVMAWTSLRMLQRIYHSFQYDEGIFTLRPRRTADGEELRWSRDQSLAQRSRILVVRGSSSASV
jgi:integrase